MAWKWKARKAFEISFNLKVSQTLRWKYANMQKKKKNRKKKQKKKKKKKKKKERKKKKRYGETQSV